MLVIVAHAWILDKLYQCIDSGQDWHIDAVFKQEKIVISEFMEKADEETFGNVCHTATVANGISVFQYVGTLVTWFFGLNLVRFERSANNVRRLIII